MSLSNQIKELQEMESNLKIDQSQLAFKIDQQEMAIRRQQQQIDQLSIEETEYGLMEMTMKEYKEQMALKESELNLLNEVDSLNSLSSEIELLERKKKKLEISLQEAKQKAIISNAKKEEIKRNLEKKEKKKRLEEEIYQKLNLMNLVIKKENWSNQIFSLQNENQAKMDQLLSLKVFKANQLFQAESQNKAYEEQKKLAKDKKEIIQRKRMELGVSINQNINEVLLAEEINIKEID